MHAQELTKVVALNFYKECTDGGASGGDVKDSAIDVCRNKSASCDEFNKRRFCYARCSV